MKKKNGFFAISIIFSFFIVFLMLITMNLTRYAQNRILLAQVKKDIKSTTELVVENHTLICKRADITTLHQSYCDADLCEIDQTKNGEELATKLTTFGNTYSGGNTEPIADWYNPGEVAAISGNMKIGDAFDCDVNGDGTYDPTTERFYYLAEQGDQYVFLYSESIGLSKYGTGGVPSEILKILPKTTEWKNVKLSNTKRNIVNYNGQSTEFNYATHDYTAAARLMTRDEFNVAKSATNYMFLREGSPYISRTAKYIWLEAPHNNDYAYVCITLNTTNNVIIDTSEGSQVSTEQQVKPVIEVPKDRVEVNFKEAN